MPNYKMFQDYADSLRVKIYGTDSAGNVTPLLTNSSGTTVITNVDSGAIYVRGYSGNSGSPVFVAPGSGYIFPVSGDLTLTIDSGDTITVVNSGGRPLAVSGTVAVSGSLGVSGSVYVSGSTVGISGEAYVVNSGGKPLSVSGTVAVSGNVGVSGSVYVSGSTVGISGEAYVVNSGGKPLSVSGTVAVSGNVGVSGGVGVFLSGRNTLDSGPLYDRASGTDSGALSGVWDVLGYNSWTLAVKYSGLSGDQVSVKLQMAVLSGTNNWVDDGSYVAFSGTNAYWIFRTPDYHVRYARLYAKSESATASGDFLVYMQGEY